VGYDFDRGALGAQCTETRIVLGAQCIECGLWDGITTHFLIRVGGGFLSEILLLQLRIWLLTGKFGPFLVPARKMD
jgi:hypothetical protein